MDKGKLSVYSFLPLGAAFVWGMGFTAQIFASGSIQPFFYNALRFALGGIALLPLVFLLDKNLKPTFKSTVKYGIAAGIILCMGASFQQIGLTLTQSAAKGGFFTALYAVLVPFIEAIIFKKRLSKKIYIASVLSFLGLFCIFISSESVKSLLQITFGDILLLINALCYAFHIIFIDRVINKVAPVLFAVVQFLTVSVLSGVICLVFETPNVEAIRNSCIPIIYGGLVSVGCGYTLQVFSQKSRTPVLTSLLFSAESVVALLGGVVILKEKLSLMSVTGSVLILISIILIQLIQAKQTYNNSYT